MMTLADPVVDPLPGGDLDPDADGLVVLFNATDEPLTYTLPSAVDARMALHPVLADSMDPVVRSADFDAASGTFTVPARTTAVFVQAPADVEPPEVSAELEPIQTGAKQGKFTVKVSCTDNVTEECELSADINGVPVSDGDEVQLVVNPGQQTVETVPGTGVLKIKAPAFALTVTCTDEAGNSTTVTVEPEFREPGRRP